MTNVFLTADWRKIIMAQYEVEPAVLTPWLPPGLELDLYHDGHQPRCYVSLVGFLFDRVRIKRMAVPFHTRFEEVNLRFYVTRTMPDGTRRRGVVFIREFVPRAAISIVARSLYEEPYRSLPMRHRIQSTVNSLNIEYRWQNQGIWNRLTVEASLKAEAIAAGSLEEFITEHYWGYTKRTRGATSEYGVQHPRWAIYPIQNYTVEADLGELYGPPFASLNGAAPANILLAEGSQVSVSSGARLPG